MNKEQVISYSNFLCINLINSNQNLNNHYVGFLKLLITFSGTIFVGSISFAHYLELLNSTYNKILSCISWVFLCVSMVCLLLALVSFLCYYAEDYASLIKEMHRINKWQQNPNSEFIPNLGSGKIFFPMKYSIFGFYTFMLGFFNFCLVLLNKFICVCPLAVILANILLCVFITIILKTFLNVSKLKW